MSEELVHIEMVTYNHELYISQAIESVLMQKTTFKYRLIIGEDCSTDQTASIVREYAEKYPEKITAIINDKNLGVVENIKQVREFVVAKYVAILEGDDYWTDPLKLQKQVDFLEGNAEFVLCFHDVKILKPNGELSSDFLKTPLKYQKVSTLAEIGNYIRTPSVVFRNIISDFPKEYGKSKVGDYFLFVLLGCLGDFGKIDSEMAVYRYQTGSFSTLSSIKQRFIWNDSLILLINCISEPNIVKALLTQLAESNRILQYEIEQRLYYQPSIIKRFLNRIKRLMKYKIKNIRTDKL